MSDHLTNIVVVAVLHRNGKIFIAKRADSKVTWPGCFELVGGHVDPGEKLEDALRREVREEIGVEIIVGPIVDAFTYQSEDTFKVEIGYLCQLAQETDEPAINPEDHSEAKWIDEAAVSEMEKDDDEVIMIRKAFKQLQGAK